MKKFLRKLYIKSFAKEKYVKLNKYLYTLSLNGLGVLNYETSEISGENHFLKSYLPGCEGVIIDVGANRGNYALEVIKHNSKLKIYAIEPHPKTYQSLVENIKKHRNINPFNVGISSTCGEFKLFDYDDSEGSSHASLYQDVITEIHGSKSTLTYDINTITIDHLVETEKIDYISLLKIDTEGNELEVLRGSEFALTNNIINAIHFEFNEMNVMSRAFFKDFLKLLNGYEIYRLLPNGKIHLNVYKPIDCEIFAYQNIVAIKKSTR